MERGRIKDGQVQVAQITPEQAIAIARDKVNYRAELVGIGLVLEKNTLLWEVRLSRAGRGHPRSSVFSSGPSPAVSLPRKKYPELPIN